MIPEALSPSLAQAVALLGYLASAVLAASAALQAARHQMDPFGATVLAFATALGGGTVRDLFLGRFPVFWIQDPVFVFVIIPVALIVFFVGMRMPSGAGQRHRLLMRLDAVGLALFTLIGVRIADQMDTGWIIAVIIGCVTGTVGGMIRDVLSNVTPSILKEDLYASISLAGGAIYLVLEPLLGGEVAVLISFVLMLTARLMTLQRHGG